MSARKYVNRFVLAYGSLSVRSSKLKVIDHWLGPVQNRQQFERVIGAHRRRQEGWPADCGRRSAKGREGIFSLAHHLAISPVSRGWSAVRHRRRTGTRRSTPGRRLSARPLDAANAQAAWACAGLPPAPAACFDQPDFFSDASASGESSAASGRTRVNTALLEHM